MIRLATGMEKRAHGHAPLQQTETNGRDWTVSGFIPLLAVIEIANSLGDDAHEQLRQPAAIRW